MGPKLKKDGTPEKKRGAPSGYKPEYCQQIIDYFNRTPYEKTENGLIPTDLPLFQGFAHEIGVVINTMLDWARMYPEFGEAYKIAKELQHKILITNGLRGLYNVSFAIFTAKNIMNWTDRQQISGDQDRPIQFEIKYPQNFTPLQIKPSIQPVIEANILN